MQADGPSRLGTRIFPIHPQRISLIGARAEYGAENGALLISSVAVARGIHSSDLSISCPDLFRQRTISSETEGRPGAAVQRYSDYVAPRGPFTDLAVWYSTQTGRLR